MSAECKFTIIPGSASMYRVTDRMSTERYIGTVARVGERGPWAAAPCGDTFNGSRRKGFATRAAAAHALCRFLDTGNRDWIYPAATVVTS